MKLFIYKHRLSGEIFKAFAEAIAEDQEIIWQGDNWAQFEQETGLDESKLKGLKLENGKVVFDALEEKKQLDKEKPLAMGTDLINYINQATVKGLADDAAFALVEKLVPFFLYLQQGRCNPASEDTLNMGLTLLDEKLINGNKALLTGLINEWKKDKRFVEPPKERPKSVKSKTLSFARR